MTMNKSSKQEKRINIILPTGLIEEAKKVSGEGSLTELIKVALQSLIEARSSEKVLGFKGKLKTGFELEKFRGE